MEEYQTIDAYIDSFPKEIQEKLKELRALVHNEAPQANEAISYGMPTFKLNGKNLVHFAGYHDHIGFYPVPSGIDAFGKELEPYRTGKGTIRFPLTEPLPVDLIRKVVRFRTCEESE